MDDTYLVTEMQNGEEVDVFEGPYKEACKFFDTQYGEDDEHLCPCLYKVQDNGEVTTEH